MSNHEIAERAYIQSLVEAADARHAAVIESMQADVNRLRDEWAQSYQEHRQAVEDRMATTAAETRAWIADFARAESSPDLPAGGRSDASPAPTGDPLGHSGLRQEPTISPAQEQAEAARLLRDMSMAEYAKLRSELGVRSVTDMSHLFGETR
jgi:hypothetical protein